MFFLSLLLETQKPLMLPYLLKGWPSSRVLLQHAHEQVLCLQVQGVRHLESSRGDLDFQLSKIWILKRQVPTKHGKEGDASCPQVHAQTFVGLTHQHLRADVARTTTHCRHQLAVAVLVAQPKVDHLNVALLIQQHILRLHIPVCDRNSRATSMQILNAVQNL